MNSALYTGWVRHRRHSPRVHQFRYRLFMLYLDLSELPGLFDPYWFWSARRWAPACFRRSDYLGDPAQPLDSEVRNLVESRTGHRPRGPIRLLTHLRYFGYCFNPVSFYYCFDADAEHVETIVAEITNTPWNERHAYVLPVTAGGQIGASLWHFRFAKEFHVSPFMPMDMQYDWRLSRPGEFLAVQMENRRDGEAAFDATLHMYRRAITSAALAHALCAFPVMTAQVSTRIYCQALKLMLKRTPFYNHPKSSTASLARRATRSGVP